MGKAAPQVILMDGSTQLPLASAQVSPSMPVCAKFAWANDGHSGVADARHNEQNYASAD